MPNYTDAELLDWLEEQNAKKQYSGRCIFRWSGDGRGWRLHETTKIGAHLTVRRAIADAMDEDETLSPAERAAEHFKSWGK